MSNMNAIPQFLKRHPFLFALFALLASRFIGLGIIKAIQAVHPELTIQNDLGWLVMVLYAALTVTLVFWTDTAEETGLRKPASLKEWLIWIPFLALPVLIVSLNGVSSWGFQQNMLLLIAAIGVAVNEEVLFRGILLRPLLRWGEWGAILIPALLFGLAHATNIFAGGDVTYGVLQTIWTFASGIAFSAMRLRNRSLYPAIVLHFVLDGVEYFSTGEFGVHSDPFPLYWLVIFALLNVALAIYALFMWFKSKDAKHSAVQIDSKGEAAYEIRNH